MKEQEYRQIEEYVLEQMNDSAHDKMHLYRVLYAALEIAEAEQGADEDVLVAACLLHDIGREAQAKDARLDHAAVGAKMAFDFLCEAGWSVEKAAYVRDCVAAHRFRRKAQNGSAEAKILFDADKLDAVGAVGLARTLLYMGETRIPLYILNPGGEIELEGESRERNTFFQEYHYKMDSVYGCFFTAKAKEMSETRRAAAVSFYESLLDEVGEPHKKGPARLRRLLEEK